MVNESSAKYANMHVSGRAMLNSRSPQSKPQPLLDPPRASISIPNIQGRNTNFYTVFIDSSMNYLITGGLISSYKLQKPLTDHHPAAAAAQGFTLPGPAGGCG